MKPLGNKIQLDIKEVKIGAIQSDSIEEHGTIVALGDKVWMTSVGDYDQTTIEELIGKTLYFKAWACDIISVDDKKYYFISADSDAILAISD